MNTLETLHTFDDLKDFISQQKEVIKAEKKLQTHMIESLSSFDNHFYYHMNTSATKAHDETDINVGFNFYLPISNDEKYTVKVVAISTSFVLYDNNTKFSSSNFSMNTYDCDIDLNTGFLMLNGSDLLKDDKEVFAHILKHLPTESISAQKFLWGLDEKSLCKYDSLKGTFPDFMQDINKKQIQPFFDHWLIPQFQGFADSQELHINGLNKNFNRFFDTLVCSLYAKSSIDTKILSNDPLEDILAACDIHDKIKNHHQLDQTLGIKHGNNSLKKI